LLSHTIISALVDTIKRGSKVKEIIENIDNNQDLIHHKSEINFYDLDDNVATVSDKVPLFHIGSETIQEEIAEHYYKLYASQATN